jgi:hypothetical protein
MSYQVMVYDDAVVTEKMELATTMISDCRSNMTLFAELRARLSLLQSGIDQSTGDALSESDKNALYDNLIAKANALLV